MPFRCNLCAFFALPSLFVLLLLLNSSLFNSNAYHSELFNSVAVNSSSSQFLFSAFLCQGFLVSAAATRVKSRTIISWLCHLPAPRIRAVQFPLRSGRILASPSLFKSALCRSRTHRLSSHLFLCECQLIGSFLMPYYSALIPCSSIIFRAIATRSALLIRISGRFFAFLFFCGAFMRFGSINCFRYTANPMRCL